MLKRCLPVLRLRNALLAPAVLLLLLVILYWKLISAPSTNVWFDHYDLCQLQIPRLEFFARSIHAGHLPLWNPHTWAGQPVLGSGQPGLLNPLNLLFTSVFPLSGGELSFSVLNWLFVVLHVLGGWFCYLFCRRIALGMIPSLAGGLAFASTGFFGTAPHLDMTSAAALTPLIFLFALQLWNDGGIPRRAAPLGLVLGLSWLTGHHEIPLINCYAVLLGSLAIVAYRFVRKRRIDWPVAAGSALAFCLALAISAVQTLPLVEFGRQAKRWVGMPEPIGWDTRVSYDVHALYSTPWHGLANFLVPPATGTVTWSNYVGVTILTLAILALIYSWASHHVRMLAMLGSFAVLYALGGHTPFHRVLYEVLPMLDKARAPERGLYLAGFAISALAAIGSSVLASGVAARRNVIWIAVLCSIPTTVGLANRAEYGAKSFAAGLALILILWNIARPAVSLSAGYVLIALVLLEVTTAQSYRLADLSSGHAVCATALRDYRGLDAKLKNDPSTGRVAAEWNQLMTDVGDLYGIDLLQSFVAAVPSNILRLELHTARTGQLFGVTYRIASRAGLPDETPLGEYARDVRLFHVKSAMPHAWIVHQTMPVEDDRELRRAISDPKVDFTSTAVMLNQVPSLEQCPGPEPVTVLRPNADTLILDTNVHCRGLLVLSDTFYPGWRAYVDGRLDPIVEVFGALRGVVVDRGNHRIEMRYQPASVYLGALLSLAALIACSILISLRVEP